MDDRQNLSQLASVITLPESNRPARIYRKTVALPLLEDRGAKPYGKKIMQVARMQPSISTLEGRRKFNEAIGVAMSLT
jgi:hypothetical protein